jgi:Holliday junction DNA helicase RuvB
MLSMQRPIGAKEVRTKTSSRPIAFADFVGNEAAVTEIREAIVAATLDGRAVPHLLLYGVQGLGKTSLARMIARESGGEFFETAASGLRGPEDIIRFLWAMAEAKERTGQFSVLFIDEIHGLAPGGGRSSLSQEALYPLLEDFWFPHNRLNRKIVGHDGRSYIVTAPAIPTWPFTCIGATTEPGMLSAPLRRRFFLSIHMKPYTEHDIAKIIAGSAERLGWRIEPEACTELATVSRRNPGRSNQLLTSARSRAVATGRETITVEVVRQIVARMGLHRLGLDENDVAVLRALAERPKGIGAAELARAVGLNRSTFDELIEPYLRQLGFLVTMSRRQITSRGREYLDSLSSPVRT